MKIGHMAVKPGDHLSVRERWGILNVSLEEAWLLAKDGGAAILRFDRFDSCHFTEPARGRSPPAGQVPQHGFQPAPEMPSWATLRWLEVVDVAAMPLTELSQSDWEAGGYEGPVNHAALLAAHACPHVRHAGEPDTSADQDAYAGWRARRAPTWLSVIRVRPLDPSLYWWYTDTKCWTYVGD